MSQKVVKQQRWAKKMVSSRLMEDRLSDLRQHVENIGAGTSIHLVGDTFRQRELTRVHMTTCDSWVFGYRVIPVNWIEGQFRRTIYIKLPNQKIMEVKEKERNKIIGAVHKVLLDDDASPPEVSSAAYDCIRIDQNFSVVFLKENKPNLVLPDVSKIQHADDVDNGDTDDNEIKKDDS